MKVSVEQAAVNALGSWLSRALGPAVVVSTQWPEPSRKLPERAVTILRAGPPEGEPVDPIVVGRIDSGTNTSLFVWKVRAVRQPLQLDVWARHHAARDELLAELDVVLNAGMAATLGIASADPVQNGVVVPLGDDWTGIAYGFFDGAEISDSPDAATRHEYRATLRGWTDVDLTITAPSARFAVIRLLNLQTAS
jgi:hypothetical protein